MILTRSCIGESPIRENFMINVLCIGNSFSCDAPEGMYRVYSVAGEFLALSRIADGVMSTVKSFFEYFTGGI